MGEIFDSPLVQFFVFVIAVMAGFLIVKSGISMLPDSLPMMTAIKNVIAKA